MKTCWTRHLWQLFAPDLSREEDVQRISDSTRESSAGIFMYQKYGMTILGPCRRISNSRQGYGASECQRILARKPTLVYQRFG